METLNYSTMSYQELYKMESDKLLPIEQAKQANLDALIARGIDLSTMDIIDRTDWISAQLVHMANELGQCDVMLTHTEDTFKLKIELMDFMSKTLKLSHKFKMFAIKERGKIRLDTIKSTKEM